MSREKFETTLEVLETYLLRFRDKIEALDFTPESLRISECRGCEYRNICRTSYALNTESPVPAGKDSAHVY